MKLAFAILLSYIRIFGSMYFTLIISLHENNFLQSDQFNLHYSSHDIHVNRPVETIMRRHSFVQINTLLVLFRAF